MPTCVVVGSGVCVWVRRKSRSEQIARHVSLGRSRLLPLRVAVHCELIAIDQGFTKFASIKNAAALNK